MGLLLGYGAGFDSPNLWGFGLGARAGYNLKQIYMGMRFMWNFGESYDGPIGFEATANVWELGIEGGYDFVPADKFTLRPELGLGIATTGVSVDTDLGGGSDSNTDFSLAFGISALYDFTPSLFGGLNIRLPLVFSDDTHAAMTFLLNLGGRL